MGEDSGLENSKINKILIISFVEFIWEIFFVCIKTSIISMHFQKEKLYVLQNNYFKF
jgi:hypothetical protein